MCTGGARKPTSCANFLRMPLMRLSSSPAWRLVDQRNQAVAHFQAEGVDRHARRARSLLPARPAWWRPRGACGPAPRLPGCAAAASARAVLLAFLDQVAGAEQAAAEQQEHQVRHARDHAHAADDAAGDVQTLGRPNSWPMIWSPTSWSLATRETTMPAATEISSAGICATRPSPMASSDVVLGRLARPTGRAGPCRSMKPPMMLMNRIRMPAIGVAAHVLRGAVHRAEELGFLADLGAALLGLLFVDQAGVQVGVDRHLLAGHRVEGEARADFGDTPGALGDDDEVGNRWRRQCKVYDGRGAFGEVVDLFHAKTQATPLLFFFRKDAETQNHLSV